MADTAKTVPSPRDQRADEETMSAPARDFSFSLPALKETINQAGLLLPIPGPITAFAFLNTLQALEDLPFDEGMQKGAALYNCEPYLKENQYRERLAHGRVRLGDLAASLREELGERSDESIAGLDGRFDIRMTMLMHELSEGPDAELHWEVAEADALRRFRSDAPSNFCQKLVDETKRWVMRDLVEQDQGPGEHPPAARAALDFIERLKPASVERWDETAWQSFTLQALWRTCMYGVGGLPEQKVAPALIRHRDVILAATDDDTDDLVHAFLIRYCAAYTDQGFADWALPDRDGGFFNAFLEIFSRRGGPPDLWQRGLPAELRRIQAAKLTALESVAESLHLLGVREDELEPFLTKSLLALRGWAGMLYQMETRGDRMPHPTGEGTLIEYVAVRLILERLALQYVAAHSLGFRGELAQLRAFARPLARKPNGNGVERRAYPVFQLAQLRGWSPVVLSRLSQAQWRELVGEIEAFHSLQRRRLFHSAFERGLRVQVLDGISLHKPYQPEAGRRPTFQSIYCIDAREESFRRHVEETDPQSETFAIAGFFGVPMYYKGIADAHFIASCPIVVRPKHWVVEEPVFTLENSHRQRAKARAALGHAAHQMHVGSRGFAGGAILTMSLGVLASVPLMARVLFPRLTARIQRTAAKFFEAPGITRLRIERSTELPGPNDDQIGFTVEEMSGMAERALRDIGLVKNFSRLIIFFGHGSFCLNNPHKSAYDCGACTGSPGGPNARAIALMLNDPRIRDILAGKGIKIPTDTVFLGGLHNTGDDSFTFLDLDLLPKTHFKDFEHARRQLEAAGERNAHERCRRFYSAPLTISANDAKLHVERRIEDLAQTRPEFGNASNAMCVVGRRIRTRGLYLDRRSFLMSYDASTDDENSSVLARILSAVVPVCEGINMTYFLSYVDSSGFGAGTKLPHNVTSLLGVMDGAASDLRSGLPWQGVEIHEPVRILFVIEATPEAMLRIMAGNPTVGRILRNGWAQLAVLDFDSNKIQVFNRGKFEPYEPEAKELPQAESSVSWYRGWRNHLGLAEIRSPGAAS